jgi:hypothetical protein
LSPARKNLIPASSASRAIILQRASPNKPIYEKETSTAAAGIVFAGVIASHISFKAADHSYSMVIDDLETNVLGKNSKPSQNTRPEIPSQLINCFDPRSKSFGGSG